MSNELVPVTILVPPPPETHEIVPGRKPQQGENIRVLRIQWQGWEEPPTTHEWWKGDTWKEFPIAFPKPRPKRLLTPAELAGKWLHYRASDFCEQVIAFNNPQEMVRTAMGSCTVQSLVDNGATYSDTPTGECRSLEVEDKL